MRKSIGFSLFPSEFIRACSFVEKGQNKALTLEIPIESNGGVSQFSVYCSELSNLVHLDFPAVEAVLNRPNLNSATGNIC
jgi:hypothetical protein